MQEFASFPHLFDADRSSSPAAAGPWARNLGSARHAANHSPPLRLPLTAQPQAAVDMMPST